jgi:hypothetical protein
MLISTSSICSSLIGINEEVAAAGTNSANKISNSISSNSCSNSVSSGPAPRRTSSCSLSLNATNTPATNSVQFKMPSNLPPVENGEVITIDIETYRQLVQDLQDTKIILHRLIHLLREQPAMVLNPTENDHVDEDTCESGLGNQRSAEDPLNQILSGLVNVRALFELV